MGKKRILVVDNEPYIQAVAKVCLETVAGWEVITAESGREAITQAKIYQPDVILLDVMMPDMDGIRTLEQLKTHPSTAEIPVIFLTAKIQPTDRNRYAQMGIMTTIAKPFDPLRLASQVAAAMSWY